MGSGRIEVVLFDDRANQVTTEAVTPELASLFSYAHQWAAAQARRDACDLTFSSMLAAMMASDKSLCSWLRNHLALRGVHSRTMIGDVAVSEGALYPTKQQQPQTRLVTTASFRTALAKAKELRDASATPAVLDVRHYMAAYAVCPQYHLGDFLRLRIDRRAWCLELAHELAERHGDEKACWAAYAAMAPPVPLLAFNTDAPEGRDLLNVEREVEAFARLIAARSTHTPLSIGVFGAWGSGKSFFMRRVSERVARHADTGRAQGRDSAYHARIAQIEFNAWHYSEGNLIACLVDHIFRNLRIGAADEDDAILRRRGAELIARLDRAKQTLADREEGVAAAEARRRAAERTIEEIDAKLPQDVAETRRALERANQAYSAAQGALTRARQAQEVELHAAASRAPALAALGLLRDGLTNPAFTSAADELRALAREARSTSARWKPIVLGLLALGICTITAAVAGTGAWKQIGSAVGALGAVAAVARSWLGKLDEVAARGQKLQDEEDRIAAKAAADIMAAHASTITALEAAVAKRDAERLAANDGVQAIERTHAAALAQLEGEDRARRDAIAQRAEAIAELAAHTAELERLSSGTLLGEFLDERAAASGYQGKLTIFTQVRNDFERLSRLMTRATEEYYLTKHKPEPTVSRIVLYIDDLDRCPEEKVIEVLRTVHLLLAFPLFVCVVGVDPRWVTRCLRNAPGLKVDTNLLDDELGVPATPTDYLEKIFQIPLWLRPLPEQHVPAIVRCLLDPALAGRSAVVDVPVVVPPPSRATDDAPGTAIAAAGHATELQVGAEELEYLEKLAPLLGGNPRALKRFVNTYRLVKTALSDVELEVFRSGVHDDAKNLVYLPYRVCMAQLAVLCTQRSRGLELVRHADDSRATTVGEWLDAFKQELHDKTGDAHLAVSLRKILESDRPELPRLDALEFSTFTLWLQRTRRYSFYL